MKKTIEDKREERIKEIADLAKKRDEINARLNYLTGLAESSNTAAAENAVPEGFPLMREVETLFAAKPQWRILEATAALQKKFPQYKIERRKVHGVLAYLARRKKLNKEQERGLFSLKTS